MAAIDVARRTSACWRDEVPALLGLVAVAAIEVAILLLGHRTFFAEPDNTTQFWAWYQKMAAALHSGALPLWDANTLAGHSFVGETQTGVFYPLNILWLLLLGSGHGISPRRLDLLVVFHLLLASIGLYALARSFKVRRLPSAIAGVVFAYTGPVFDRTTAQTAIFFGLAYVPWAVFFAHRQIETGRLRFAVGTGVAVGLGVLAGHFEPPFHAALLVVLFYALTALSARSPRGAEIRARATGLALTIAVAAVVALPQLAYSLPYLNRAYRFVGPGAPLPPGGTVGFTTFSELYSGSPSSALSVLDPQIYPVPDANDLFIGLAALAVLMAGAIFLRGPVQTQMGRYRWPLTVAALIGALAMLGPWTFFPVLLYVLPFVTEVRELGRYSIMVHLVLCLILAFVLQAIRANWVGSDAERARWWRRLTMAAGAFLALDGIYLLLRHVPGSDSWFGVQLLLGGVAVLVLTAAVRLPRFPLVAVLGTLIVAAGMHNDLRLLGSTSSALYPSRYYARTVAISYAEKACAGHRVLVLDDALPANVGDVYRQLHTENGYGATMHAQLFDFITNSPETSREQTQLLDLRCIVSRKSLAIAGYDVGLRDTVDGVTVYVDDFTSPLNTLQLQSVPVTVLRDDDRHKLYMVTLERPTTVIVSAIMYPGWHLQVDGRGVRAGSFRVGTVAVFPEVTIPAGRHTLGYSWSGLPA